MPKIISREPTRFLWNIAAIVKALFGIMALFATGVATLRTSSLRISRGSQVGDDVPSMPPRDFSRSLENVKCDNLEILGLTFKAGYVVLPESDSPDACLHYSLSDHLDSNTWVAFSNKSQANYLSALKWAQSELSHGDFGKGTMPFNVFLYKITEKLLQDDIGFESGKLFRHEQIPIFFVEGKGRQLLLNSNIDLLKMLNEKDNSIMQNIQTKVQDIVETFLPALFAETTESIQSTTVSIEAIIKNRQYVYNKIIIDLLSTGNTIDLYPLVVKTINVRNPARPITEKPLVNNQILPKEYQLTEDEKTYLLKKMDVKNSNSFKPIIKTLEETFKTIIRTFQKDRDAVKMVAHMHMLVAKPLLFRKGNGRAGRLIMNLFGMANKLPPIVFDNRKEYLHAVHRASYKNDPNVFADYVRVVLRRNNLKIANNMCRLLRAEKPNCRKMDNFHSCLTFLKDGYDKKRAATEHQKQYRKLKSERLRNVRKKK